MIDKKARICNICDDNIENRLGYIAKGRCPPGAICGLILEIHDAVLPEVMADHEAAEA